MKSNRGGSREGAGRKPTGKESVVVRVPVELLSMIEDAKKVGHPKINIQSVSDAELVKELERRGIGSAHAAKKELRCDGVIKPFSNEDYAKLYGANTKRHECTEALQFASIAISQLNRIRKDDPKRTEALVRVRNYINDMLAS